MIRLISENRVAINVKAPKLKDWEKRIILTVHDDENSIEHLLQAIQGTANSGHSFPVVLDPDDSNYRQEFYIDGDGSDYIRDITIEIW